MDIFDETFAEPKRTKKYVTVVAEFSNDVEVRSLWIADSHTLCVTGTHE